MYEYKQGARLLENGIFFEYEPIQIDWCEPINNGFCHDCTGKDVYKNRKYTPDFWFPKSKLFVETKGKFTAEARTAMSHIVMYAPHEIRMVFMTDNWLSKKHSMRYSRWCELHNIKYAIGNIPLEWVSEDDTNNKA